MFEELLESEIKAALPWDRDGNQAVLEVRYWVTTEQSFLALVCIVRYKQVLMKCQRLMVFFTFIKAFVVTLLTIRNSRSNKGLSSRL